MYLELLSRIVLGFQGQACQERESEYGPLNWSKDDEAMETAQRDLQEKELGSRQIAKNERERERAGKREVDTAKKSCNKK